MNYLSNRKSMLFLVCLTAGLYLQACLESESRLSVETPGIRIEFNDYLHTKIISKQKDTDPLMDDFHPSSILIADHTDLDSFKFKDSREVRIDDKIGSGRQTEIYGLLHTQRYTIEKKVIIQTYDRFPAMLFTRTIYTNQGTTTLAVNGWMTNHYTLKTLADKPPFWSFQGASYESRPDWVLPLHPGFSQKNYMGMNATDYGGGIPVVDIWRRDGGMAVGLVEKVPRLVSLPVSMPEDGHSASLAITYDREMKLAPGDSISTYHSFLSVHTGDYFQSLRDFSQYMQMKSVRISDPVKTAYEPVWCAWGYEREFDVPEVLRTLPKVKELGYQWAVLDDGWQTAEGDWFLNRKKFPNGDADMIRFVKKINQAGLKAKLWWTPLAVDPGTKLIKEHPDFLLINAQGETQDISWWDSYYLCPAYQGTIDYTKALVTKFMKTWGFAGLKIDGQHLNAVPPCYNPIHQHAYPEESVEKLPEFFKMIYQTALSINPQAVVEICACGTVGSYFHMPYLNQSVSSDPMSSWQIRLKGKTTKALMGPRAAFYGDHVELSDKGSDFASSIGIGAVIGTKFTWPQDKHPDMGYILTPEKETEWKKWTQLYKKLMLPEGTYLGTLYDIGYDRPETHVVEKDSIFYYAFYDSSFAGSLQFRGFPDGSYSVYDYENQRDLGRISSRNPELTVKFRDHLLVMLKKEN